ncbi:hypothetical protein L3Y34_009701 [Caenorhabditis briggsae]|uniref:Uncharacterized protein n=1 Tax=Caenorhabditis briggsae TaxID=6238 RepID=A0AAE9A9E5_CAEBR|nr:hypothetical protein L3Y34_009701 [Caenorhabditis briggsae]
MNSPDQEQEKFIAQINEEKKKVANEWNIPNMHELTWSQELSDIVATISKTDYEKTRTTSSYTIMTYRITDYTAMGEGWKTKFNELLNKGESNEFVNSLQTDIACVKRTNYGENITSVCLLGPENTRGQWKKGVPGSECKWKYKNSSGICTRDIAQEKFIDGLNSLRRQTASLNGYPQMRKLIWIETLHNVVRSIIPSNTTLKHDKRGNWRFIFISNYTTGLDKLKNAPFDEDTVYKNLYWHRVEHINPFQSAIACYEKANLGYGFKIMCLFGFEKDIDKGANYRKEQTTERSLCVVEETPLTQKPLGVTIPSNGPPNSTSAFSESPTSSKSPLDPKQRNQTTTQGPNPNSTFPGPKILGIPQRKFPETATLPKELEDYVEVDGDDYDEDFPTGEPLLDSGFENFLQFWITYCDQNLQIFVNQLKVDDSRNNSYLTPVLSMDQNGISELNRARDKWCPNNTDFVFVYTRHEYMYPLQTTVACVRTEFWPRYNYSCFFGPK